MKFLIDECLSPELAMRAQELQHEASHVAWIGAAGSGDWTIRKIAVDGDWTLVTRNSVDFRGPALAPGTAGQYADVEIHAGLICLNATNMDLDLQLELFETALDVLGENGDLVNQGLEISLLDGEEHLTISRYDLPRD